MPRERFTSILAFLHLNSNTTYIEHGQEGHDPIHKIRPFFSHLQEKFQMLYVPEQEICVDEAMCPFKGKSHFRIHMKDKPIKWGFKFHELCESKSGYVYQLEMFCGQPGLSNKPYEAVIHYIQNMAGVDQSDRMTAYFPMLRESLKWWKKPFFHLLNLCTVQTMILLNKHQGNKQRKNHCFWISPPLMSLHLLLLLLVPRCQDPGCKDVISRLSSPRHPAGHHQGEFARCVLKK